MAFDEQKYTAIWMFRIIVRGLRSTATWDGIRYTFAIPPVVPECKGLPYHIPIYNHTTTLI